MTRRKPAPVRPAPVHYAAIGTDGARPVVWGLGSDASGATWDAYDQDDSDGWEMQGTAVVRVSRQVAKRIRAGEVSCETLGISVEVRDGRIVGATSPSSGPRPVTGKSRRHPIQARLDDDELAAVTSAVEAARARGEDTTPSDWLRRHGVAAARQAVGR